MSAVLFYLVIDWFMRNKTEKFPRGIRWSFFSILENFDFADDLALLPHTHKHIE
jgi:hypothetical protein